MYSQLLTHRPLGKVKKDQAKSFESKLLNYEKNRSYRLVESWVFQN